MMTAIPSQHTTFLDQPPSCLEFCPAAPDYLVIGTYLLSETPSNGLANPQQTKTGSIQLFKLDPESPQLTEIHKISLPHAVFDLHFSPRDPTLIAIATSVASVSLYSLGSLKNHDSTASNPDIIIHLTTIPVHEDLATSVLYLSWLPPGHLTTGHKYSHDQLATDGFAVSFSDGRVSIFHTQPPFHIFSKELMKKIDLPGEPIEVWYTTFHRGRSSSGKRFLMLFSGDDFGSLRVHEFAGDGGVNGDGNDEGQKLLVNGQFLIQTREISDRGKHHGAGITVILPLFSDAGETVLLTGCYDEYLRVYKFAGRGEVLAEKWLGGGVWRLNVITEVEEGALTTEEDPNVCWSEDCKGPILDWWGEVLLVVKWDIEVLAEFTEHESMNYASDVWRGNGGAGSGAMPGSGGQDQLQRTNRDSKLLCVSSSFYDKRVDLHYARTMALRNAAD
ncbi:hypothetical protein PAAG_12547 [Paracoccidioides lutzii Pb01]|uniref:Uncharacterized protein n=1 Tax=Paracoccidioides lutzii (strain ATCC MYA-826 / Pb01) TaxID=502779 RepID=A0A0A2V340_PARBA|nr:hypothetical protein PAAG_12547 [Paracoccidioides lutzii Pb01]KGQ00787.1 hypothetical protein PAAG_12547 [Paracoccidioides lutzii Pb01]